MKPLLIAHKGNTNHYAENSIDAFKSAIALGADGIECDVQFFNGQLLIEHKFINPDDRYVYSYPSLKSVLDTFSKKTFIEIDIKSFTPLILPILSKLLNKYQLEGIELISSFFPIIPHIRKFLPKAKIGVVFNTHQFEEWMTLQYIQQKVMQTVKLLGANIAHVVEPRLININLVSACRQNNISVHSHISRSKIVKQLELYDLLKTAGAECCTIDDIELIKNLKLRK